MKMFMAGGVTGNLNPAFNKFAKTDLSDKEFIKALKDENFWQGGSQDTGYKM